MIESTWTIKDRRVATGKDFDKLLEFFRENGIKFPEAGQFQPWLKNLDEVTNNRFKFTEDIPSKFQTDIRTYLANIYNESPDSTRIFPGKSCRQEILSAVSYLRQQKSNLPNNVLVLAMLKQIMKIQCAVIYRTDVVPSNISDKADFYSVSVTTEFESKNLGKRDYQKTLIFERVIRQ